MNTEAKQQALRATALIANLRAQVERLTRANEILIAQRDELRMVCQPKQRIFEGPQITNWQEWERRMKKGTAAPDGQATTSGAGHDTFTRS